MERQCCPGSPPAAAAAAASSPAGPSCVPSCPCCPAALLAVAAQAVHLNFEKGLEGWEHSEESKWIGRFEAEVPANLEKKALKVRVLAAG